MAWLVAMHVKQECSDLYCSLLADSACHAGVPHSLLAAGPALAGLPDGDAIRDQLPKGGNPAEKVKEQVGRTGPKTCV